MHPEDREKNSVAAIVAPATALPGRVPHRPPERRGALVLRRGHHLARRRRQAGAHERRHRRHHRSQARRGTPAPARPRGRPSRQEHAGRGAVGAAPHQGQDARPSSSRPSKAASMRWPRRTISCRRRTGRAPTCARSSTRRWRPIAPTIASASSAEGPAAMLLPATAQAVALALHELATNAAKYGALSTEPASCRLTWSIGPEALELEWLETGGPPAQPPSSLGFGLVDRALEHRGAVPRRRRLRLAPRRPALPAVDSARADRQSRAGAADRRAPAPKSRQGQRARAACRASAC